MGQVTALSFNHSLLCSVWIHVCVCAMCVVPTRIHSCQASLERERERETRKKKSHRLLVFVPYAKSSLRQKRQTERGGATDRVSSDGQRESQEGERERLERESFERERKRERETEREKRKKKRKKKRKTRRKHNKRARNNSE